MNITVKRIVSNTNETISLIYVDDDLQCWGLEDEHRVIKLSGETRIPSGTYPVKLRTAGSIHPKYLKKFPDTHKGMLWLQDVPGFTYIYFHIGNTDEHTAGCILTGAQCGIDDLGTLTLQNSTLAYKGFYDRVIDAAWHGSLIVEVIDEVTR